MKFEPNHVAGFIGKGIIIHAAGLDVHKSKLSIYINKRHKVRVYHKPDLNVVQLEKILKYLNSRLGRWYDWPGLISFIFPFIRELPNLDYCVEVVRDSYLNAGIGIIPVGKSKKCTPKKFEKYVKNMGFLIAYVWDKGQEGGFSLTDIPAGAIVFCEGFNLFSKLIKWWQNRIDKIKTAYLKITLRK